MIESFVGVLLIESIYGSEQKIFRTHTHVTVKIENDTK